MDTPSAAEVVLHAIDVFGTRENAIAWLQAPNAILEGRSPEDLFRLGQAAEVDRILTRIEYGVFS